MTYISVTFITTLVLYLTYMLLFAAAVDAKVEASGDDAPLKAPATQQWSRYSNKRMARPLYAINAYRREHVNPVDMEFMDESDIDKRGTMDDYGHLRFGKRGQEIGDYGYMRFGRR
ncbi:drosulfakinins [Culicoides brevitarsis]|uniref:drosulfakinins n=1 Tax=Culicoides brevitarsis TaxID=469753 RepID=UPI00307C9A0F